MVKKLTALLVCALFITGAALADEATVEKTTMKSEKATNGNGKRRGRYNNRKKSAVVYETDTVVQGGSCSTGRCNKGRYHEHMRSRCADKSCGQCSREAVPAKPCCEKAVTVRAEPCLHKHVQYSWTCPATYAEAPCEVC